MSNFNIFITNSAVKKILELQQKEKDNKYLRISVDSGGCGGFQYNYSLIKDKDKNPDDTIIHYDGICLVIDKISQGFLNKCKLHFVRELGNEYFDIINPNATNRCGCGNSFSV